MKSTYRSKMTALALCAGLAALPLGAGADDIDIFTGSSAGTAINPRILIVLDNTSNWARQNQKWPGGLAQGQSEARAIRTVLDDLDIGVSLGLMEYVTGGTANDDGGFIRSAVVPMNDANKLSFRNRLTTIYDNVNDPTEKRNSNTPYGNLMYDVYNYFSGGNSFSPAATLASKADSAGYTTQYTRFASPLTTDNTCGKSFVIFIGNPNASGPSADSPANSATLNALNNNRTASGSIIPVSQLPLPNFSTQSVSTPSPVGTTAACYPTAVAAAAALPAFATACADYSDGCKIGDIAANPGPGTCDAGTNVYGVIGTNTIVTNVPTGTSSTDTAPRNADEWARLLYTNGVPVTGSTIRPSVVTYTIDVYNAQPDATQTSLLLSMAKAGGGKYFAAKNEQAIVDALKQIMIEIQAINTSFASTSLPVNATNRSQNLNEVYIGMFRPDSLARPRWFGNLKRYQLIRDAGGNIELGDAGARPAVNPVTGFLTPCATSYWTRDSGQYWSNLGITPDPAGTCTVGGLHKYSDAPDGPLVEKGAVAQMLREGNGAAGGATSQVVNRNMFTVKNGAFVDFTEGNTVGLSANLVKYIRGEDVDNEKNSDSRSTTRPSIHGDVVHSRPLPINYGSVNGAEVGVTVYYGANDGTLRAVDTRSGVERWAFVAPEFFPRLGRIRDNSPLVSYPRIKSLDITPTPMPKDYFFDGSTGVYQSPVTVSPAGATVPSKVWIYPSMRRGGRMIYAIDVSAPAAPAYKWRAGCPNLTNDTGCTSADMAGIGQTWSTPNVAFIKGYSATTPVVVFGGGYDRCEDEDTRTPACGAASATKGGYIYVLDAATGALIRKFATARAVAADVAMVDIDNDGMPDYLYAADTGGALYRVDFRSGPGLTDTALASTAWTSRRVAATTGAGRKFLFAPTLLHTRGKVYVAIGSGDREHPLHAHYPYANVLNRFYVYKDDLASAADTAPQNLDAMEDYTSNTSCSTDPVLPDSALKGWFMDLNQYGQGEQVVTSALMASGMVTFSTNRPLPPATGTCSTPLGQARGYWVSLLNGSGAIGVQGACGGSRAATFAGGGLPPSPVLARGVPVNGKLVTVVIGAADKGGSGGGGDSALAPRKVSPTIAPKRKRAYTYTSGE